MHATVSEFPGRPDAAFGRLPHSPAYGLQPGHTPLLAELVATLDATLGRCHGHAAAAAAKAALRGYACDPALLAPEQKEGSDESYRRHLLYAAPDGAYSLLAIVWRPGQCTPIHGHTAWGAVAVVEGEPFCENYDRVENRFGAMELRSKLRLQLHPGDLATVRPGIDDLHRIGNASRTRAITLHAYGRDLLNEPARLNIVFPD